MTGIAMAMAMIAPVVIVFHLPQDVLEIQFAITVDSPSYFHIKHIM